VGFVAKYNNATTERQILNVNERQMWDIAAGTVPVKAGNIAVSTYPNPASATTVVQFNVPVKQKVRIRVTNAMGQVVVEKDIDNALAGQNAIELNTAKLSSGIYNVAIIGSNISGASKLMVAH
jgi:hypothetical protein